MICFRCSICLMIGNGCVGPAKRREGLDLVVCHRQDITDHDISVVIVVSCCCKKVGCLRWWHGQIYVIAA